AGPYTRNPFALSTAVRRQIRRTTCLKASRGRNSGVMPIGLTDSRLREPLQAAQMVPPDLRDVFLERVAAELRGKDLGDRLVHRVAYAVARTMTWDAGRTAAVG